MKNRKIAPMLKAIIAAALFGASAPISKLLLGEIAPTLMASFLYLGSGIGLFLLRYFQSSDTRFRDEARLTKNDWPWIIGAVLVGGIAAPIVLMFGLKNTPASTTSLLLNFEGVATTVIAVVAFKEAVGKRIWMAVLLITMASILLSWDSSGQWGFSLGAIGVLSACVLWGIDNNFTRNVSAKDPLSIVAIKGLSAGTFSLILSIILGFPLPSFKFLLMAMVLGYFSYGLSIVLFIRAMRELGSARTSALFGTAPFVGAVLSLLLFRESQGTLFFFALPIMIIGAVFLFKEEHEHLHEHETTEHEHRHNHNDSHHTHVHSDNEIPKNGHHSHVHGHEFIIHVHEHAPDIYHRHAH
ncbi:DMT family transporter [Desulfosporosinus metallidurans]|uniref:Permease of the drug/metabolite transporter (DMT) superfamily n=2 Tax=Desulfosporosinus metallidurans TaxID=1888891 RepID=A0A1Q8QKZ5_9FIRM|nr:DMT family transporter [Desulfosporosinus metallidurans]OLN28011.1 Permease of the drug/metabolite transporter (DMT) superfamily [Desulfosporosinus metallidurans]